MLPLNKKTGCRQLDALLQKPFTYIRDYVNSPNFIRSIPYTPKARQLKTFVMHRLGKSPGIRHENIDYPTIPALFIHEFSDILLYNGIPFDADGNILYDAIRKCTYDGIIDERFSIMGIHPDIVGNNYYVYGKNKFYSEHIEYIDAPCLFADGLESFGHRLTDTITNFWVCKKISDLRILVTHTGNGHITSYLSAWGNAVYRSLSANEKAHFDVEKIFVSPSRLAIVKKMYIPTRSYMHQSYITDTAKNIWSTISQYYADPSSRNNCGDYPTKIYVSRKKISRRSLVNEDECINIFAERGFSVIEPEAIDPVEQIRIFASASHVAGCAGSGMHNILFSNNPSVKVLFLCPPGWVHNRAFAFIENAFGRAFHVVYGSPGEQPYVPDSSPWHIDVRDVDLAVDQWLTI